MLAVPATVAVLCLVSGCSRPESIKVGSTNTTEQTILGEIISQHIEKKLSRPVERKFNLAGTTLAHQAMEGGDIDLYPEYTGTALTMILKIDPIAEPSVVLERCRQEYRQRMGAEWMDPLGFTNSFAIIVRGQDARQKQLDTISDAVRADAWRLAVSYEFQTRPDGLGALNRTYKLAWKGAPRGMSPAMMYAALDQKSVDMVAGNVTDGWLNSIEAKILKDEKSAFLPYQAAIVVRQDALAATPTLQAALAQLSGKINEESMRRMNFEVDAKKRNPREVAAEWMKSAGF